MNYIVDHLGNDKTRSVRRYLEQDFFFSHMNDWFCIELEKSDNRYLQRIVNQSYRITVVQNSFEVFVFLDIVCSNLR